jgi:hypothetical protein
MQQNGTVPARGARIAGVYPTRLKRKSYRMTDEYLELGDPFDAHPLNGLL